MFVEGGITVKRHSAILFLVAVLMLGVSLAREGFISLWPLSMTTSAVPVTFTLNLRLVLDAEGVGAEGGKVSVVVNGKAVATFASGSITLLVRNQDKIEIDSDLSHRICVIVRESASEIILPQAGDYIQVQNTVETLGRVVIRRRNG